MNNTLEHWVIAKYQLKPNPQHESLDAEFGQST